MAPQRRGRRTVAKAGRPKRRPTRAPGLPPKTVLAIFDTLDHQHPNADTELHYRNPYELLVATILSAQSTDARVNIVTPPLFERYPSAAALAKATTAELEPQIRASGFFRAKSRSLLGMAAALVQRHGGEVPATMEALVELPGVGRKTANVVLGHALGVPGLPVDRHVVRVANRIGLVHSDNPEVIETQLCAQLPPDRWTRASDVLILHGRRICRPRPLCDRCQVRAWCAYFKALRPKGARRAKFDALRPPARKAPAARAEPSAQSLGLGPQRQQKKIASLRSPSPTKTS